MKFNNLAVIFIAMLLLVCSVSATLTATYYIGNKTVIMFYDPGTVNWTVPANVTSVDYLIVGGGGGGGRSNSTGNADPNSGGGGGGGVLNGTGAVTPGIDLTIVVGDGGLGGFDSDCHGFAPDGCTYDVGGDGDSSLFGILEAFGGGGGGAAIGAVPAARVGRNGGNGGGGGGNAVSGGTGVAGQGNDGDQGSDGNHHGGSSSLTTGFLSNITGTAHYYGTGGGGGSELALSEGGGDGARGLTSELWPFDCGHDSGGAQYMCIYNTILPEDGTDGLGGGGGGDQGGYFGGMDYFNYRHFDAGNGGSGVVIVSYDTPAYVPPAQPERMWAATHNVKITARSTFGGPIENALINATYVETSGPLAWLYEWVGVPYNVSVQTTTLSGHTGADGSVNFLMVESVQYNITATKVGEISASMLIYPKDDDYTIWAEPISGSILFPTGYNELEQIQFIANGTELTPNTAQIFTMYNDSLGQTTWTQVQVNRSTSVGNLTTETIVGTYTTAGGNFTKIFALTDHRDKSYIVRMRSAGTTFGNVSRDFGIAFPPGPISFGIPEDLLVYVGMLGIFFIGLCFTRSLPGPAAVTCIFFAWLFLFMGWWRDLAPDWIVAAGLLVFSVVAVIFVIMLRSKKTEYQ